MNLPLKCPRCGTMRSSDGDCPHCELALGLKVAAGPVEPAPPDDGGQRIFGHYELLEQIGHGGMGVVYRARDLKLNRLVALKLLLLGEFSSEQSVARFRREAQAAAVLRHPHIVAIHEVGQCEGQHYFTMELVEGRSLASVLRDGPIPARQAATYLHAIADATATAHSAGILHRDLKPANILIDVFDRPRITDFGLAKPIDDNSDLTVSGQMLGSPNYLAPELAAGHDGAAAPASDIFSLGAVLYECLTGRGPFLAPTIPETLLRIRDAEPIPPATIEPTAAARSRNDLPEMP